MHAFISYLLNHLWIKEDEWARRSLYYLIPIKLSLSVVAEMHVCNTQRSSADGKDLSGSRMLATVNGKYVQNRIHFSGKMRLAWIQGLTIIPFFPI